MKWGQGTAAHSCSLAGTRQGGAEPLGSGGEHGAAGRALLALRAVLQTQVSAPQGQGAWVPACYRCSPVSGGPQELLSRWRCCGLFQSF